MKFYKYDYVYTGYQSWDDNDAKFIKQTKISYIGISSAITFGLILIYSYILYESVMVNEKYKDE